MVIICRVTLITILLITFEIYEYRDDRYKFLLVPSKISNESVRNAISEVCTAILRVTKFNSIFLYYNIFDN